MCKNFTTYVYLEQRIFFWVRVSCIQVSECYSFAEQLETVLFWFVCCFLTNIIFTSVLEDLLNEIRVHMAWLYSVSESIALLDMMVTTHSYCLEHISHPITLWQTHKTGVFRFFDNAAATLCPARIHWEWTLRNQKRPAPSNWKKQLRVCRCNTSWLSLFSQLPQCVAYIVHLFCCVFVVAGLQNNCFMTEVSNLHILTGPNSVTDLFKLVFGSFPYVLSFFFAYMQSGKSTYMRQIGVLTILAHVGCFVPADFASFRLTNQLMSRTARQ